MEPPDGCSGDAGLGRRPMKAVRIITLVRQDRGGLALSRSSVWAQSFKNMRHTIVTAPSTDGSEELAQEWEARGEVDVWRGAPRGIYPAMNWALNQTSDDEAVLFLNAGDFFLYEQAVNDLVAAADDADSPWSTGSFVSMAPGGWIRGVARMSGAATVGDVGHQATLVNSGVLRDLGGFDESYRVFADGKLLRRVGRLHRPGLVIPPVVAYALGGFSTTRPGIVTRELARLNTEERTGFGNEPATSPRRQSLPIKRHTLAVAHSLHSRHLVPSRMFRTRRSRRRAIDHWMHASPHWEHTRVHPDSLLCCLTALPRLLLQDSS